MMRLTATRSTAAASSAKRMLSTFKLPDLPYDFGALEPIISGEIMQIHHSKHHNAYVTNLNIGMEKLEDAKAKNDINAILSLQQGLKFNGGGHINHSIFWQNLAPIKEGGGILETGDLSKLIDVQFGSLANFQTTLSNACIGLQGSGWGWLGYDKATGRVR
jgi:Fe-Mn family superoxide dismutase